MGRRYSKLPSELFLTADTFDLMVMDCAITWEKYIQSKNNNEVDSSTLNQDELLQRLNRVRNEG
jgi:hypothetical protein